MSFNILNCDAIIVDYRIDKESSFFLESMNIELIYTFPREDLYKEINGHPDIVATSIGDITILEPKFYNRYKKQLEDYNVIEGKSVVGGRYPYDIGYNVVILNKYAIGKINYIDLEVLRILEEKDYKLIDVNQGYSRCSTAIIGEKSIITADVAITKSCHKYLDVCQIQQDEIIKLGNMKGFIGGASFLVGNKLVFFGNIKKHRSYGDIKKFCDRNNIEIVCTHMGELMDYGSIIPLYKNKSL